MERNKKLKFFYNFSKMSKNGRFFDHLEKFWLKIFNKFLYIFWL